MDTQEILNLQEAYLNVYSSYELNEEEADRLRDRRAVAGAHFGGGNDPEPKRKPSSGTTKPQTPEADQEAFNRVIRAYKEKYGSGSIVSSSRTRKPGGSASQATEQYDLYDIVLSHLLDEGYADSLDSAEKIMIHMSEDWRDTILDEALVDWRTGKLPSGRTPRSAANRKLVGLQTQKPSSNGRQQLATRISKIKAVKGEMDDHTSFSGKIGKLLTPGLGNRPGATPRMSGGEPNTQRHQAAIYRRNRRQENG